VTAVGIPGVGESQVRLPRNGHGETRSPDSHQERSQPATGWSATGS
jgi:hypothetical protein